MHLISPRVFLNRRQLRVLGVDPSIANCGWGVIEPGQLVGMGIIHTDAGLDEFERYEWIAKELTRLIEEHRPEVAVVEQFQHFFRSPAGDAEGDGSPCRSGGSPVLQGGEDVKLPPDAPDAHDDTLALADALRSDDFLRTFFATPPTPCSGHHRQATRRAGRVSLRTGHSSAERAWDHAGDAGRAQSPASASTKRSWTPPLGVPVRRAS